MAENLLGDIYAGERQSYDQQLDAVLNIAQTAKKGAVRKKQLQQEMEQQKELAEFESELQKERQMEVAQVEQQADLREQYNESLQNAQEEVKGLIDEKSKDQYRNVTKYNLDPFNYNVEQVEQGGQVVGARPSIQMYGQEIDYGTYNKELVNRSEFGDFLDSLNSADELADDTKRYKKDIGGDETEEHIYVGKNQKDQLISQIKQDPEVREQYYTMYQRGQLHMNKTADAEDGEGGGSGAPSESNVFPIMGNLKTNLYDPDKGELKTKKNYKFAENVDDSWFGGSEKISKDINYTVSVSDVKNQIDKTFQSLLPKEDRVSIGEIPKGVQNAIMQGQNIESDEVSERVQKAANQLASYSESTREQLQELFTNYTVYDSGFQQWQKETGNTASEEQIFLDIFNAPDQMDEESYQNLFKPMSEMEERSRYLDQAQAYRSDVESAMKFGSNSYA